MKKTVLVLLLLSLSSVAKDHGKGDVSVNGQIQESACNIHLEDVLQSLTFDNVKVGHILNNNENKAKDFTIRLVNCSVEKGKAALWETVNISFDGPPDRQNGDLFSMSGKGSGVAVQIKDSNGQQISPGDRVNIAKVEDGQMRLDFKIRLVSNGTQLLLGNLSTTIKFTIEYQ